jgi:hypothetical protein
MAVRVTLLILGAALLAAAAAFAAGKKADDAEDRPGASARRPLAVSLVRLIAAPGEYDGKHVRVHGFVSVEHEGTAVYLHRDDWQHMLTKNGLWLAVNDSAPKGSKEAEVAGRYALIEGRFSAKKQGHMGLWSGAIEDVTRMVPLNARKAK